METLSPIFFYLIHKTWSELVKKNFPLTFHLFRGRKNEPEMKQQSLAVRKKENQTTLENEHREYDYWFSDKEKSS